MKQSSLKFIFLFLFIILHFYADAQYQTGDFGFVASNGNWGIAGNWRQWNIGGAGWTGTLPASQPGFTDNVYILAGDTAIIEASGKPCKNLTVETGAVLYANDFSLNGNRYFDIYGNVVCNGIIGNGSTYDNISFEFSGSNDTISGTGTFNASRFRKSTGALNAATNLFINRNVTLWFDNGAGTYSTAIYNNNSTNSIFNVTLASGDTLNILGAGIGSAAIDGIDGGVFGQGGGERGGTFTINGVMIVPGSLFLSTSNTLAAYTCKWIVNGELDAYKVYAPKSGYAGHSFTLNSGGKLNITGPPAFVSLATLSTDSNTFIFNTGSKVEYSAAGNQTVRGGTEFGPSSPAQYYNLTISGSGTKTVSTLLTAKNNLTISNSTGSPVLNSNSLNINVGGNWTNYDQSGFTEGLQTVTFNGSSAVNDTITCPGGEVFYNMTMTKTNTANNVVMNSAVDVINTLSFSSTDRAPVCLNGNKLTLRNSSSSAMVWVSGTTGSTNRNIISETVTGSPTLAVNHSILQWNIGTSTGTYIYPFGIRTAAATVTYIPVTIVKSVSTSSNIGVSTRATSADNLPWDSISNVGSVSNMYSSAVGGDGSTAAVIDRWWNIIPSTPVTADVTFTYRGAENTLSAGYQTNSIAAQNWNGTNWLAPVCSSCNNGTTGATGTVVVNGASLSGAPWVLTSQAAPLPVTLLDFSAEDHIDFILLNWITTSEIINDYFTVEKSKDGKEFFAIGRIEGAGNSTSKLYYNFVDDEPYAGLSYYRLRQTDDDGNYTHGPVVSVYHRKSGEDINLFPNPAGDRFYLGSKSGRSDYQVEITDLNGRRILQRNVVMDEEGMTVVHVENFYPGIYFVKVDDGHNARVLKLVKE